MPITKIYGQDQIQNYSIVNDNIAASAGIETSKLLSNTDFNMQNYKLTNLANGTNPNDAVTVTQLNTAVSTALTSAVMYKGTVDASLAANLPSNPKVGDYYKVAVSGNFQNSTSLTDPTAFFNVGDGIIFNGTTWDKIDNIDTRYISGDGISITNNGLGIETVTVSAKPNGGIQVDSTGVSVKVADSSLTLSASGLALNQTGFVVGEAPVQDVVNKRKFTLANIPIVDSEAVYYNGTRMRRGTGNDYTITGNIFIFEAGVKAPDLTKDNILVDYRYLP